MSKATHRAVRHAYRHRMRSRRAARLQRSNASASASPPSQHRRRPFSLRQRSPDAASRLRTSQLANGSHLRVNLPSAHVALLKVQTEKQTLLRILTPPNKRRSRCLFALATVQLIVSLALLVVFIAAVAVLSARRGVAGEILALVDSASNNTAVVSTQLLKLQQAVTALSDTCIPVDDRPHVAQLVTDSTHLVTELSGLLANENFLGPRYALENTYLNTVVLTLGFVTMCMQLTLGVAGFMTSVLSCCLFRWGNSRVICHRTSVMAYKITSWMLALNPPLAWTVLGGFAAGFAAVVDECWGPYVYMTSEGDKLSGAGVEQLTKQNFTYAYSLTRVGIGNGSFASFGGEGFNLANFFASCELKLSPGDLLNTGSLGEGIGAAAGSSSSSSAFNPYESLLVRAAWHVDALAEALEAAGTCGDVAADYTTTALATMQDQHRWLTCAEVRL
jgi:hypothetical protein